MRHEGKVTIQVVGPLRLVGSDGCDRTPKGRKACALLGLLALAPENKRARKWLQDKLWSDRGEDQGSQSLRQTLSEIRRALGPDRACLHSDGPILGLDSKRIVVSVEAGASGDESVLLEGLDIIRDPEFENWLRDRRAYFETERDRAQRQPEPGAAGPNAPGGKGHDPPRLQLVLEPPREVASQHDLLIANALTDIIAKTMMEIGSVDVIDHRSGLPQMQEQQIPPLGAALAVQAGVIHDADGATWRVMLAESASKRLIWSAMAQQRNVTALNLDDADILRQLNQIVDIAIESLVATTAARGERAVATLLCRQGMQHLARLGQENFLIADRLFEHAFELEPRGIYLAWRAYLRIYLLIECKFTERKRLIEEAMGFISRALEKEPLNSYVASFAAHVHAFMRRSYVAAYELAERSVQLNRANPLGWVCLGVAECYLGKSQAGQRHALIAREIAGTTPFRFQVDALSCIASAIAGDLEKAIWCGQSSHALSPQFAVPLRYLSALYLANGQHDLSRLAVEKLQAFEPEFSYDALRDEAYPVAGLHRSTLIKMLPAREI